MIAQSELQQCRKRAVLEPLSVLIAPFAPHLAEEMWHRCGNHTSVCDASWPVLEERYLVEDTVKYPVQFNGKVRFTIELAKDMPREEVERVVLASDDTARYLAGNQPKKVIVVPGRIVNIVC